MLFYTLFHITAKLYVDSETNLKKIFYKFQTCDLYPEHG